MLSYRYLLLSLALVNSLAAQGEPAPTPRPTSSRELVGEIHIQGAEETKDPYAASQDGAIQYFQALRDKMPQMINGEVGSAPPIDPKILNYLTGAYLYCIVNTGVCPVILESILEVDIINSRLNKEPACPNMRQFWKLWLDSDMEQRHKYLVRTGHLAVTSEFKRNVRPKFVQCVETVKEQISEKGGDQQFFKKRYSEQQKRVLFERVAALLEGIKSKERNVFVATGSRK